jgi:hypothetical protein
MRRLDVEKYWDFGIFAVLVWFFDMVLKFAGNQRVHRWRRWIFLFPEKLLQPPIPIYFGISKCVWSTLWTLIIKIEMFFSSDPLSLVTHEMQVNGIS